MALKRYKNREVIKTFAVSFRENDKIHEVRTKINFRKSMTEFCRHCFFLGLEKIKKTDQKKRTKKK